MGVASSVGGAVVGGVLLSILAGKGARATWQRQNSVLMSNKHLLTPRQLQEVNKEEVQFIRGTALAGVFPGALTGAYLTTLVRHPGVTSTLTVLLLTGVGITKHVLMPTAFNSQGTAPRADDSQFGYSKYRNFFSPPKEPRPAEVRQEDTGILKKEKFGI